MIEIMTTGRDHLTIHLDRVALQDLRVGCSQPGDLPEVRIKTPHAFDVIIQCHYTIPRGKGQYPTKERPFEEHRSMGTNGREERWVRVAVDREDLVAIGNYGITAYYTLKGGLGVGITSQPGQRPIFPQYVDADDD